MSRVVHWFQQNEQRMFYWVNGKWSHSVLDGVFSTLTHLGGAACTIVFGLAMLALGPADWRPIALQSIMALAFSHIPVAVMKKKYPRVRPYMVLPGTNTCKNPLTDHSFPSGHTTAIFSILTPYMLALPLAWLFLLPIAVAVGLSRIYLGLHYPSDCAAGALLGIVTALLVSAFI